jgi:GNAT superfamily N-acetyltransferase
MEAAPVLDPSQRLRRATRADLPRLAATLADAFHDDPVWGPFFFPDVARRRSRLVRFFEAELGSVALPLGEVWTTEDVEGVAVWAPPGFWRVPLGTALAQLPPMIKTFGRSLPRVLRALRAIESRHPREPPHFYLAFLGVAPPHQGRGIGTALLQPVLERCDREGTPSYLEASTTRSAACYERAGFAIQEVARIPGGPAIRLMWRPPAGAGSEAQRPARG